MHRHHITLHDLIEHFEQQYHVCENSKHGLNCKVGSIFATQFCPIKTFSRLQGRHSVVQLPLTMLVANPDLNVEKSAVPTHQYKPLTHKRKHISTAAQPHTCNCRCRHYTQPPTHSHPLPLFKSGRVEIEWIVSEYDMCRQIR